MTNHTCYHYTQCETENIGVIAPPFPGKFPVYIVYIIIAKVDPIKETMSYTTFYI